MYALHKTALYAHIAVGAVALIVFWIPMAARKGSPLHRRAGRYFLWGMTAVAITGVGMSTLALIDPVGTRITGRTLDMDEAFGVAARVREFSLFLLMLSVLVYTAARQATLVLLARGDRQLLRQPWNVFCLVALGALALITGYVGLNGGHVHDLSDVNVLLVIFAVISLNGSVRMLHYTFKATIRPREWMIEHIGNAIGCGIAAYTAFAAFGGRELLGSLLPGMWQVLPWVLPTVIGTVYARRASRDYRPGPERPADVVAQ